MVASSEKHLIGCGRRCLPDPLQRKRLNLSASLYEILQILSLIMFERTPLDQLLTLSAPELIMPNPANQFNLFM